MAGASWALGAQVATSADATLCQLGRLSPASAADAVAQRAATAALAGQAEWVVAYFVGGPWGKPKPHML